MRFVVRCLAGFAVVWFAAGSFGCGKSDGGGDRPAPHMPVKVASAEATAETVAPDPPDAEVGQQVFIATCATCHGFQAQGLPHQGAPLRTSTFIASHDDRALIEFIKQGRPAKDPGNASGVAMPPRGNNPAISDARLADVVAFLRQVQAEAKAESQQTMAAPSASPTTETP
jgi:mono/diheme cytochrome c family protein